MSATMNRSMVKPVNFECFAEAVQQLAIFRLLVNQPPKLGGMS